MATVTENLPWIEKYRPKTIDDISAQEETVRVLKKSIVSHNLPHLLFYGPPGTGKTSSILALSRQLYGPEMFKSRVLELNASDDRGIAVIREKVKNFARYNVTRSSSGNYPCPPYKIIILDEADSLTADAQAALRRTMETYSKVTRFCLVCNYVTRIIEPLSSRCAKFRFRSISPSLCISRLQFICEQEKFQFVPEALERLVALSGGDLRKAIMHLQSAQQFSQSEILTPAIVESVTGSVPETIIDQIVEVISGDSITAINDLLNLVITEGYAADVLVSRIHERIIRANHLSSRQKSRAALKFGAVDRYLIEGADEQLQLLDSFLSLNTILKSQ